MIKNTLVILSIFLLACSISKLNYVYAQTAESDIEMTTDATDANITALESGAGVQQNDKQQAIITEYVVKEGDTLSGLTQLYLGDNSLWRLNAEINPELTNYNFLKPGSTIRLITGYKEIEPEVEAHQALVEVTSNEVNKSLQRGQWQDAINGDELKPRDGVRTQANSSAILVFDDSSRVQMTEYTQVFLRDREVRDNGITRNEIEIEKGEAELKLDSTNSESDASNEFEIMIGEVRTTPKLNAEGKATTKARRSEDDSSQIMVYAGDSNVESGGVSVAVETGMGTVAKSGEAPLPPEKLLDAVQLTTDNPSETTINAKTVVSWNALDGAASYTLTLCSDAACNEIFRTEKGLTSTTRTLTDLPEATVHWRVAGVSASGLDGYPSNTDSIIVSKPPPPPPEPEPEENGLPWYVWVVIIAYLLYFLKVFTWYAYK